MKKYVLEGRTPRPAPSDMEWHHWYNTVDRHVATTTIGGVRISTVFLAEARKEGDPLFETMVFWDGPRHDERVARCWTWEEAEAQHEGVVEAVRLGATKPQRSLEERVEAMSMDRSNRFAGVAVTGGTDNSEWMMVVYRLLKHFEDNEGTTYLYNRAEREAFLAKTPISIRALLEEVFTEYHKVEGQHWQGR